MKKCYIRYIVLAARIQSPAQTHKHLHWHLDPWPTPKKKQFILGFNWKNYHFLSSLKRSPQKHKLKIMYKSTAKVMEVFHQKTPSSPTQM